MFPKVSEKTKDSESFGLIRLTLLFYIGFGARKTIPQTKLPKRDIIGKNYQKRTSKSKKYHTTDKITKKDIGLKPYVRII